jgi:hypothetical protein
MKNDIILLYLKEGIRISLIKRNTFYQRRLTKGVESTLALTGLGSALGRILTIGMIIETLH